MKFAFSTLGCPNWSIKEIVERAKEYGYDGVELRGVKGEHISPDISHEDRKKIKRMFGKAGVDISCITAYTFFTADDKTERQKNISLLKDYVLLANDVGAGAVRTFGGKFPETSSRDVMIERIVFALIDVCNFASEYGITILLETHDGLSLGNNLAEVMKKTSHKKLAVLWDYLNAMMCGEPMRDNFEKIKDYIGYVHLHDADEKNSWQPKLIGEGSLPIPESLELLKGIGYEGYLSLEWEKKWHPEIENPERAFPQYIRKIREYL